MRNTTSFQWADDEDLCPPAVYVTGDWTPQKRREITLPENLPRELHRLVWWLDDIGCVRSPFMSHRDCFDIPDIKQEAMCGRCRALRPYREPRS